MKGIECLSQSHEMSKIWSFPLYTSRCYSEFVKLKEPISGSLRTTIQIKATSFSFVPLNTKFWPCSAFSLAGLNLRCLVTLSFVAWKASINNNNKAHGPRNHSVIEREARQFSPSESPLLPSRLYQFFFMVSGPTFHQLKGQK